MNIRCKT